MWLRLIIQRINLQTVHFWLMRRRSARPETVALHKAVHVHASGKSALTNVDDLTSNEGHRGHCLIQTEGHKVTRERRLKCYKPPQCVRTPTLLSLLVGLLML